RSLEWSQADAPVTVTHQILLFRCAPGRNPEPRWGSSRVGSLQLRRKFADQILNFFCFVSVTDQKRVLSSHNNEIMNSKQCDGRPILFENDVVAGIDRSDGAIRGVSLLVFLKMIRPDRGWVSRESAGLDGWSHCRGACAKRLVCLAQCNRSRDRPMLV